MSHVRWRPVMRARPVDGAGGGMDVPLAGRAKGNRLRAPRTSLLLTVALAVAGCNARLPDPDSPGARLYADRCGTCHRIYAPRSLTFEMWKVQVERKQGVMVRQGLPPLTPEERAVLLDYLKRHSQ